MKVHNNANLSVPWFLRRVSVGRRCSGSETHNNVLAAALDGLTREYNDGDGNKNGKKAIGWIGKTTTLHVYHAFLYISLPSLQDHSTTGNCLIFTE